jgi:hypothetical protein
MLEKIKSIIESCKTIDQLTTCLSFVETPRKEIGPDQKIQIVNWIREKQEELQPSYL